jgi:hypothetical protein
LWAVWLELNIEEDRGESGTGDSIPSPSPPSATGTTLASIRSPWGLIFNHPRPLIEEFPARNRGSGPVAIPSQTVTGHARVGDRKLAAGGAGTGDDADLGVWTNREARGRGKIFSVREYLPIWE